MRCLIFAKSSAAAWVKNYFPDVEPYFLKFVNKPLIEYFVDLASLLRISDLRIVSDTSVKDVEKYFQDGARWGVRINYSLAKPDDSIEQIYLKNLSFCREDDILIINGFFFTEYDKSEIAACREMLFDKALSFANRQMLYIPKGQSIKTTYHIPAEDEAKFLVREIAGIPDYFRLSLQILRDKNQHYVLPGYSNEKDAFYGINFIFPHSSTVNKPIMIGNNVRFLNDTAIGPNVIAGNNVIVDSGAVIEDSIVYDNTYIGSDLELKDKIVYKNHLISGLTGELIEINDDILVARVDNTILTSWFDWIMQKTLAAVLLIIMTIPWLMLFPLLHLMPKAKLYSRFFINRNCKYINLTDPRKLKRYRLGRLFIRLSLDKYIPIWISLTGKLKLTGNHLFEADVHNHKIIKELPMYKPGAFSLIESVDSGDQQTKDFYELAYINQYSALCNTMILYRSLVRRFCNGFTQ